MCGRLLYTGCSQKGNMASDQIHQTRVGLGLCHHGPLLACFLDRSHGPGLPCTYSHGQGVGGIVRGRSRPALAHSILSLHCRTTLDGRSKMKGSSKSQT